MNKSLSANVVFMAGYMAMDRCDAGSVLTCPYQTNPLDEAFWWLGALASWADQGGTFEDFEPLMSGEVRS